MTYYEHIMLERGEPVSNALRQWIDEQGIEAGIGQFYEMKSDERAAYLITENDLNNLGYSYLNEGRILEAIAVFQLNTDEYPKSWNAYGSLAEAYVKNGDQQLAIENYEHSVELNPDNTRAKNAIEELKAGF
jgi:tetratricopeptide (TPR) repeat protein